MTSDVVVVGAGPVGLLLAAELRLADVDVLVLERSFEPNTESRAMTFHARTAEILDMRGILDGVLAEALTVRWGPFGALNTPIDASLLPTRHQYSVLHPQARTEAQLEKRAVELGVRISRGQEVVAVRQDADAVTLQVRGPDGPYELSTRYVVGCDGGSSVVRAQAGIAFPGSESTRTTAIGDAVLTDPPEALGFQASTQGVVLVVPLDPASGLYRVGASDTERIHVDKSVPLTLDELRGSFERIVGTTYGMSEARWLSRFGNAARQAERYRDGRILLAGDAAHIHSPLGAQGLNLGLQDAMNLGWKLAGELAGWAPPGLLDTYHLERHPVGRMVLDNTMAQGRIFDVSPEGMALRNLFTDLMQYEQVQRHLAGMISAVDVAYPPRDSQAHPLVGQRAPDISVITTAGRRTRVAELLRSGRPVLLHLGPGDNALAAAWHDRVDVVSATLADDPIHPQLGGPQSEAMLIRPDGHVAWATDDTTRTDTQSTSTTALTHWFGPPGPPLVP